jgi:hypothetical protein
MGMPDDTIVIARHFKNIAIKNCEKIPNMMHVLPVADNIPRILGSAISAT